jgi:TolB-like protein/Flp pilus assembly protein TadD
VFWRRYDAFISYSREDLARVQLLVDELRRRGYRVFFDVESIVVGQRWKERLEGSIRASRALVLCWSERARNSEYVHFEYARAEGLGKPVLPWLLDQTSLPKMVELQGISAVETGQVAAALQPQLGWPLVRRRSLQGLVAALVMVVLAFAVGRGFKEKGSVSSAGKSSTISETAVASKQKVPLPLPDKPSIAVLPFVNLSGEKAQEQFSDGLTDGIINAVSKLRNIFVISRNSTFTYKGKNVKVQQVAEEMGVQYVLEGSVQRTGDKVRVTAQLVDALSGRELMSEQYDRNVKDVFALQDEITMNVLSAMRVVLTEGEMAQVMVKGTKNLNAYLKVMQAVQLRDVYNPQNLAMARQFALSWVLTMCGDDDRAVAEAQRGVDLDPNSAQANHTFGSSLVFDGQYEQAIPILKKALRLSPVPFAKTLQQLGGAYRRLGRNEEAVVVLKELTKREPDAFFGHMGLAAAYMQLGKEAEARAEAAELLRINPNFSLERLEKSTPAKDRAFVVKNNIEPLRKAGLK